MVVESNVETETDSPAMTSITKNGPGKISVTQNGPALTFELIAKCSTTKARVSKIHLPHQVVDAPVFMPVGTQGTLKGLAPYQIKNLGCQIMLSNTYHLGMRPGPELLDKCGGLHNFMAWDRALLTDSGGFQMVSLLKLAKMTEQGVNFESPYDGSQKLLTPEESIRIQNSIGADIMMQLDDVVASTTTGPRVEEAMWRSIRWLDRCVSAHGRPKEQNLFAIVQGGLDVELRKKCAEEMVKRDLPGYAIGGLSGGEAKDDFWKMVNISTDLLPETKPRYCMGVGYATDLVVCVALGVDMFDCVFPTRSARFGYALTSTGSLSLKKSKFSSDVSPIEADCPCATCKTYSRAFLHAIVTREAVACQHLSIHNVTYQLRLMAAVRDAIVNDAYPQFIRNFMRNMYGGESEAGVAAAYPQWAVDALQAVGVDLMVDA